MSADAHDHANALNVFLNTAMPDAASLPGVIGLVDVVTGRAWAVHDNPAGGLCVDTGRADDLTGAGAIVRGSAAELLSWLRGEPAPIAISGDNAAADALRAAARTD